MTFDMLVDCNSQFDSIWLVKKHTAMLVDFLDTLGIPNENGVVEDLPGAVDDANDEALARTVLLELEKIGKLPPPDFNI